MQDFSESKELRDVEKRVRRLYGMSRITVEQHNVAIHFVMQLRRTLSDTSFARGLAHELSKEELNVEAHIVGPTV